MVNAEPASPQVAPLEADAQAHLNAVYQEEEPLAHESARWSLLDAVKGQLQDRDEYTRMLIAFPISEDATLQTHLKQELINKAKTINEKDEHDYVSGIVVIVGNAAVGLFEAAQTSSAMKIFQWLDEQSKEATPALQTPRLAYISELKGTRVLNKLIIHERKNLRCNLTMTIQQDADFSMTQEVFKIYRGMLNLSAKIKETTLDKAINEFEDESRQDHLPTTDELTSLCHTKTAEHFFTFQEYHESFVGPVNLVLASEVSWPTAQPLTY